MKKLLFIAAITLLAAPAVSANSECNPWANADSRIAVTSSTKAPKAEKKVTKEDKKATERHEDIHRQAHIRAINSQHPQK